MKALNLCADALERCGAYAPGYQQPVGSDFDLAFRTMKSRQDAWQLERLTIDHIVRSTFVTVAAQASYTIAVTTPASDWVLARPDTIQRATLVDSAGMETDLGHPITGGSLTDDEYTNIALKTYQSTPSCFWYQKLFPAGKFYPYPVPNAVFTIALYVPTPLSRMTNIDDTIYLPPGYQEAITSDLHIALADDVFGKPVSDATRRRASQAKAAIKAVNDRPPVIATRGYLDPNRDFPSTI